MRIRSLLKSLAAATSLFVMLTCGQAHASPMTVTVTGTIDGGGDNFGIFGTPGPGYSVIGMSYSMAITVDPTLYAVQSSGSGCLPAYPCHNAGGGLMGTASMIVTVGNTTRMFSWDLSEPNTSGQTFLANGVSMPGNYSMPLDEVIQFQQGKTSSGSFLYGHVYAYSYINAFGINLSFDQSALYTLQPGDVGYMGFTIGNGNGTVFWDNDPATICINCSSGSVPEPATLALFALALAGAGLTNRRKRAR